MKNVVEEYTMLVKYYVPTNGTVRYSRSVVFNWLLIWCASRVFFEVVVYDNIESSSTLEYFLKAFL
jgi:hypothetical protein